MHLYVDALGTVGIQMDFNSSKNAKIWAAVGIEQYSYNVIMESNCFCKLGLPVKRPTYLFA